MGVKRGVGAGMGARREDEALLVKLVGAAHAPWWLAGLPAWAPLLALCLARPCCAAGLPTSWRAASHPSSLHKAATMRLASAATHLRDVKAAGEHVRGD